MISDSPSDNMLPSEWREEWSRELALPLADSDATEFIALLVFRLGTEWFSLPASSVVEVTALPVIHRVPHRDRASAGVVNVRGRVTVFLGLTPLLEPLGHSDSAQARLVVFLHQGWIFAARADAVDGVHRIALRSIEPPPPPADSRRFTTGLWTLAGRSIAKLDENRLFAAAKESLA